LINVQTGKKSANEETGGYDKFNRRQDHKPPPGANQTPVFKIQLINK